jgi:hypothetical protein
MQIKLPSSYSDDEIRRAAEIREWLVRLISDKHEEIENLRVTLSLVDSMLKLGSFKAASSLKDTYTLKSDLTNRGISNHSDSRQTVASNIVEANDQAVATDIEHKRNEFNSTGSDTPLTKDLFRVRDNLLLARAEFTGQFVDIIPAQNILLSTTTPPFRSFFLGRILDGMKVKDEEKARNLQIKESESLTYTIEEGENSIIRKIRINNYRERERLNEIFNTCAWVFSRMIEKGSR